MSEGAEPGLRPVPDPPELPEAARPFWPAWFGPAGLVAALVALIIGIGPTVGVAFAISNDVAELIAVLVQDIFLVVAAFLLALTQLPPRPWHFGLRSVKPWPAIGWAVLGATIMLAFELGFLELINSGADNNDFGSDTGYGAGVIICLALIVVAPVTEELFFRGCFYRALRTRMPIVFAVPIASVIFAALHFQNLHTAGAILPVIGFFAAGQCLLYEKTGSIFVVMSVHALFNTFASLGINVASAITVGLIALAGLVVAARVAGPAPSPFGSNPRRPRTPKVAPATP